MEMKDGKEAICAKTRADWRKWLTKSTGTITSVWLILYHKKSTVKNISYNDAMEEAVCFGWIDSKAKKRDTESFYLTFTPRNPRSKWSKPNRERAEKMIAEKLMTEQGQAMIDLAKKSGRWEHI